MISLWINISPILIHTIWMDKSRKRTAVDNEPWNECTELGWCEEVYFEHGDGVGANRLLPEAVNAEFGDYFALTIDV